MSFTQKSSYKSEMASVVEVLKELDAKDLSSDKAVAVLADVENHLRHSTVFSTNELNLVRNLTKSDNFICTTSPL